jgi:hypothetical protein
VDQSISQNLDKLMKENPGFSLESFALNFNDWTLTNLYSDLDIGLGMTYSSADASDFYSECWSC